MNIASTPFELCDIKKEWRPLAARIARSGLAKHLLRDLYRAATTDKSTVSVVCPDGLVIMAIKCYADGTTTAWILMAASMGAAGAFKRQQDHMADVARAVGADSMGFRSDRKGWVRMLGPEWCHDGEVFSRSL